MSSNSSAARPANWWSVSLGTTHGICAMSTKFQTSKPQTSNPKSLLALQADPATYEIAVNPPQPCITPEAQHCKHCIGHVYNLNLN